MSDTELDSVAPGGDGGEGLQLWGGIGGVLISSLDRLVGTTESMTFLMVFMSSGMSAHSTSETKIQTQKLFYISAK